jgi:hypothetical protein
MYRQAGFYIFVENFDLAKEKLGMALSEDFNAHTEFLENFPTFHLLDWVNELIEEFNPTNEGLE